MKKRILFLLLSVIAAMAAHAEESILVTAGWLKEHINDPDLVILQVGYLRLDYEREHITGSQFLWPGWLAPDSPEGSFNAPDPAAATELLQKMGVSGNSRVVLCHVRNEVSVAARMFLTLEDLGLKGRVLWLNGGLDAWKKEGYPVTDRVTIAKKGNFKAKLSDLLVDKVYVQQAMQANNQVIVDARMQKYYDGEPTGLPRDGHIPGAKNIPYPDMIDDANMFKPAETLQGYFTPVAGKDKEIVAYCFIGQTASVVYMAGRILGYKMKLYDGSLQEWTRIPELPMEVTKKEQ
ncbi:sulfurtransferase [Ohtaekwangia sp.]|uniref:sulfurtransferase n=1 Tax=Ohtaekwangia sp. TaxID=2066019 RepID=UPI002FDCAF14